jgi:hypothetical protein
MGIKLPKRKIPQNAKGLAVNMKLFVPANGQGGTYRRLKEFMATLENDFGILVTEFTFEDRHTFFTKEKNP